jgi:predicted NUDIX family NTP pyrophosphohydrolase
VVFALGFASFARNTFMPKRAAGVLLYRQLNGTLEVLLAHPGGPLWAKKDHGAWSIPKGEYTETELPRDAARREFKEETTFDVNLDKAIELRPVKQKSGKIVIAFAIEGDIDASKVKSNTFPMEWPPKSGRKQNFPEIDRAEWFKLDEARFKIRPEQVALLAELEERLHQHK